MSGYSADLAYCGIMKILFLLADGQGRFADQKTNRDNHWRLEVTQQKIYIFYELSPTTAKKEGSVKHKKVDIELG